jgi:hypothetical protein
MGHWVERFSAFGRLATMLLQTGEVDDSLIWASFIYP